MQLNLLNSFNYIIVPEDYIPLWVVQLFDSELRRE